MPLTLLAPIRVTWPPPLKSTVAPVERTVLSEKMSCDTPVPAEVTLTAEAPLCTLSAPTVWWTSCEAALPTKLSVPPPSVTGTLLSSRVWLTAAELSSRNVPPRLTVTPVRPLNAPSAPPSASVPPATTTLPLVKLCPVSVCVPLPLFCSVKVVPLVWNVPA